jgi:hypothetical protein
MRRKQQALVVTIKIPEKKAGESRLFSGSTSD